MAKRFVWRLEVVLKAKYRAEEQKQQMLARAIAQLASEQAERRRILDLQAQCREDLKRFQSGRLNLAELTQINTYLEALDRRHHDVARRIEVAQKAVEKAREALAKAVRERQVLENLKMRDYQAFQKAERKRDQVLMDELAARRRWFE